ncbi:MAG TPA: hypothetical protein VGH23_16375 [Rhizomicrobium sp.]|jgi:hypothetical protein
MDAVRSAHRAQKRARERETMTSEALMANMMRVIRDRIEKGEHIALEHFQQANLPTERVMPLFQHALAAVKTAMATEQA